MKKNGKTTSTLYAEMTDYLESMIAGGALKPGERLPALRDLGKRFLLKPSTTRRGIEYLCEKGLLELRHGSGTYVATDRALDCSDGEHAIAVFLFNDDLLDSYCAHALRGVQEEAAKRNWPLRLFFTAYEDMADGGIGRNCNAAWDCDAVIMLGCYDTYLRTIPQSRPCVGLEMHENYGGLFSTISIDPFAAAETAVKFFRDKGIRHVRIFSHYMPIYQARAGVFELAWRRYGSSETISFNSAPDSYWEEEDFSITDCGYYSTSGSIYQTLASEFRRRHGMALCEARTAISIDGKSLLLPGYEPANTIAIDWRAAGVMILEEAIRRVENPGTSARKIYLNGNFHNV